MSCTKFFLVAACARFGGLSWQPVLRLSRHGPWRRNGLFLFACAVLVSVFASCDKADDPTLTIDYFFLITSTPPDYEPVPKSEDVYAITRIMMDSIRKVYPKATIDGNDGAVISVCDRVYRRYLAENPEVAKYFFCLAHLNRGRMRGSIVVSYTTIRRYNF